MKLLISFSVILFFVISVTVGTIEHDQLLREKRHTGTFSRPNSYEAKVIQTVINSWRSHSALGGKARQLIEETKKGITIRMDLTGSEMISARHFDRYAVQDDRSTFSVIHVQHGIRFGIGLIRAAFEESMGYQSHVFLTEKALDLGQNRPPGIGRNSYRDIIRKWNKNMFTIRVWGVYGAIKELYKRFDETSMN